MPVFDELESFPYPEDVLVRGQCVLLSFNNIDGDLYLTQDQLLASLNEMGLIVLAVFAIDESPEGESEDSTSNFYLLEGHQLIAIGAESIKQQIKMQLNEDYSNSKAILWKLASKKSDAIL